MPENPAFAAAATAPPPVPEFGTSRLHTLNEPLDVLVPFVYHRSLPHLVRPVCSVTVEYTPATVSAPAPAGWSYTSSVPSVDGGRSTTTYAPASRPHRAEVEAAVSGNAFSEAGGAPPQASALSFAGGGAGGAGGAGADESGERKNVKQGFLETLLSGGGGGADGDGPSGADGKALPFAGEVRTRLHDDVCDATHVDHPALLVLLVEMVAASRAYSGRTGVGCVKTLDLSHTNLGLVGPGMPPTAFDASGEPLVRGEEESEDKTTRSRRAKDVDEEGTANSNRAVLTSADAVLTWTLPLRFFPDESEPRRTTPSKILDDVAQRSLSLCYIAPLLYLPSGMSYRIETLSCTHCHLNDRDANALARIIRHPFTKRFECHLRTLDLSHNDITNSGALALSNAIKYNRGITQLDLSDNAGISDEELLDKLNTRLRRNQNGQSNLAWYEKPKRWFR